MCVTKKNGMMNFLTIEETKMGTNYELIDNLSKSDVPKHTSQDWFIDRIDVLYHCKNKINPRSSERGQSKRKCYSVSTQFLLYTTQIQIQNTTRPGVPSGF
jgi:hypothetical protein